MSSGEAPLSGVASPASLSSSSWANETGRSVRVRKTMAGGGRSGLSDAEVPGTADAIRGIEAASAPAPRSIAGIEAARSAVLYAEEVGALLVSSGALFDGV